MESPYEHNSLVSEQGATPPKFHRNSEKEETGGGKTGQTPFVKIF